MYVCICMYMYVYVCICMYVYIYKYICVCMCVYIITIAYAIQLYTSLSLYHTHHIIIDHLKLLDYFQGFISKAGILNRPRLDGFLIGLEGKPNLP